MPMQSNGLNPGKWQFVIDKGLRFVYPFVIHFQAQLGARAEVLQKEEEDEVDNFFAKFDQKSAAVTKSALKTIQRIEKEQNTEF